MKHYFLFPRLGSQVLLRQSLSVPTETHRLLTELGLLVRERKKKNREKKKKGGGEMRKKKRKKKPSTSFGFCSLMPGRSYQIPAAQFLPDESFVFILAMNSEAQMLLRSFYTYCRVFKDKITLCYIRNVSSYSSCACCFSVCPLHLYDRTKHIISPAQLCFMLTVSLYWQCLGEGDKESQYLMKKPSNICTTPIL